RRPRRSRAHDSKPAPVVAARHSPRATIPRSVYLGIFARQRQGEHRRRALRAHVETPLQALGELARDREAEPRALDAVGAVEGIEDTPEHRIRDAETVVGDAQPDAALAVGD